MSQEAHSAQVEAFAKVLYELSKAHAVKCIVTTGFDEDEALLLAHEVAGEFRNAMLKALQHYIADAFRDPELIAKLRSLTRKGPHP